MQAVNFLATAPGSHAPLFLKSHYPDWLYPSPAGRSVYDPGELAFALICAYHARVSNRAGARLLASCERLDSTRQRPVAVDIVGLEGLKKLAGIMQLANAGAEPAGTSEAGRSLRQASTQHRSFDKGAPARPPPTAATTAIKALRRGAAEHKALRAQRKRVARHTRRLQRFQSSWARVRFTHRPLVPAGA